MTNFVYIATSLDGFIATREGGLDWLDEIPNPEQSDYGYAEFMSSIDAVVMGRNTLEKILTLGEWPYQKPVFVLSRTLTRPPQPLSEKVEIINEKIKKLVADLDQRGYSNLYIDGGQVIQSFLREDLIDEMIITRVPILLGDGVPLFGPLTQRLPFKHQKTEIYNNNLIKSHYVRDR